MGSIGRRVISLGASRTRSLLLRATDRRLPRVVHVAGTNGKGSVCGLVSQLLGRLTVRDGDVGRRVQVGSFGSPFMESICQSVTVDGVGMGDDEFRLRWDELEGRVARRDDGTTQFEMLTVLAIEWFESRGVDVSVVECGVGGERDATNVFEADDVGVSVLCSVSRDHVGLLLDERCGKVDELAEITSEKVGIFKQDVPVVVDASNWNNESVRQVVEHAVGRDGRVKWCGRADLDSTKIGKHRHVTKWMDKYPVHQHDNLAIAMGIVDIMIGDLNRHVGKVGLVGQDEPDVSALGCLNVDCSTIANDIERKWAEPIDSAVRFVPLLPSGRSETVNLTEVVTALGFPSSSSITMLIDGAHNAASCIALASFISTIRQSDNLVYILAISGSRNPVDIIRDLNIRPSDHVGVVQIGPQPGAGWVVGIDPDLVVQAVRSTVNSTVLSFGYDLTAALVWAESIAGRDGVGVVMTGSLYLVADYNRLVHQVDPDSPPVDV